MRRTHKGLRDGIWVLPFLAVFLVLDAKAACPATFDMEQFSTCKREALSPLEPQMQHIRDTYKDDPAFKMFLERLNLIDKVGALLMQNFQSTKSSTLDDVLSRSFKVSQKPSDKGPGTTLMSASDVIAEYKDVFAAGLPFPPVTKDELNCLRKYYDATSRAVGNYIADHGRVIAAIDKERAPSILYLCLVMSFLHVGDENWSQADVQSLRDWMKDSKNLRSIEDFSFQVRRPFTAYQVALFARQQGGKKPTDELSYADYLKEAAARLTGNRDYQGAMVCLKAAIEQKQAAGPSEDIVALRFALADVLSKTGHGAMSADEVKTILDGRPDSPDWGKAAMLRLKYLYEAGLFDKVAEETPKFREDKRCEKYLPQIIYIAWVTHRRENRPEEAQKLQDTFLKQYPKHPLCADMYFASAMTALAASNYDEALRQLEIIEYRYSTSAVSTKAKQVRERLEATLAGKDHKGN
jgi:tetratricopeptide (TPR) repeat protein